MCLEISEIFGTLKLLLGYFSIQLKLQVVKVICEKQIPIVKIFSC